MNQSLQLLGKISKTHGFGGKVILVSEQFLEEEIENLAEIFIMIDGLPVPFPVQEFEFKTDTSALVKLEFIDNPEKASQLTGCEVYADISYTQPDTPGLESWTGYTVYDHHHGEVGVIQGIEDYKGNIVIQIINGGQETLISLFPELVTKIDDKGRKLYIQAPDGYFE